MLQADGVAELVEVRPFGAIASAEVTADAPLAILAGGGPPDGGALQLLGVVSARWSDIAGIRIQTPLRAGALAIYCGQAIGGSPDAEGAPMSFAEELLAPLLGGTDVDLITGTETPTRSSHSATGWP